MSSEPLITYHPTGILSGTGLGLADYLPALFEPLKCKVIGKLPLSLPVKFQFHHGGGPCHVNIEVFDACRVRVTIIKRQSSIIPVGLDMGCEDIFPEPGRFKIKQAICIYSPNC